MKMSLKAQIEDELKTAMIARDQTLVTTLRGLKASILNAEVAKGVREVGLPDDEIIQLLSKEAKKRQESADFFVQGGSPERAEAELAEKAVIEKFLPARMSDAELTAVIDGVIGELGDSANMGQVIGLSKTEAGPAADGATIARLVKERLDKA